MSAPTEFTYLKVDKPSILNIRYEKVKIHVGLNFLHS
jgi:hypothetical protein